MSDYYNGLDWTNDFDPPAEPKHLCDVCKLAEQFNGLSYCPQCWIAYCLADDPDQLNDLAGWSKSEQAVLTREIDRQATALVGSCYITTFPKEIKL